MDSVRGSDWMTPSFWMTPEIFGQLSGAICFKRGDQNEDSVQICSFDVTIGHLRGDAQSYLGLNDTTKVEAAAEGLTLSGHVSRCVDSEHTCIHVKMAWAAVLSWPGRCLYSLLY